MPLGCLVLQLLLPLQSLSDYSLQLFPDPQGVGKASLAFFPQSRGKPALFCLLLPIKHVFTSKITHLHALFVSPVR